MLTPLRSSDDRPVDLWDRARTVLAAGLGGGLVVTALGLGVVHVLENESWEVHRITISGNQHASDIELRHLADVHAGAHLFSVDLTHAVANMERHPWVRSAEARRGFPGSVELIVEEYHPELLLALNGLWYVDSEGRPFKRALSDDLDYPVLTGIDPDLAAARPELAAAIVAGALRVLAATSDHPSMGRARTSEVHFDPRIGFILVLRNGTELVLGFSAPAEPLARLDRLVAAGLNLDKPQRIDLDGENVAIASPLRDFRAPPPPPPELAVGDLSGALALDPANPTNPAVPPVIATPRSVKGAPVAVQVVAPARSPLLQ